MNKDTVLPLVINPIGQRPVSARAQRDADLVILERDYVSRARVKVLVKALQILADPVTYQKKSIESPAEIDWDALPHHGFTTLNTAIGVYLDPNFDYQRPEASEVYLLIYGDIKVPWPAGLSFREAILRALKKNVANFSGQS